MELEASSERKREALRRTQAAAAEARRREAEAEQVREEAAYLSQFGLEHGNAETAEPVAPGAEPSAPGNTADERVPPDDAAAGPRAIANGSRVRARRTQTSQ